MDRWVDDGFYSVAVNQSVEIFKSSVLSSTGSDKLIGGFRGGVHKDTVILRR